MSGIIESIRGTNNEIFNPGDITEEDKDPFWARTINR